MPLSNEDVVRLFYEGWTRGRIDFEELVAEDIVNHQPQVEPEHGRGRFAGAIGRIMAAAPDSRWTIADVVAHGDRVAVRTTWSGTYRAPEFRDFAVAGSSTFAVEHIQIYRVADGRLAEHWVVRDDLVMSRQLGALA